MTTPGPDLTTIGVLGVGRLGSSLLQGFKEIGVPVLPRGRQDPQPLAEWLARCQVVCLSVRDDQLAGVVATLQGNDLAGKTILIHAGTVALEVLAPLAHVGAHVGKFHPLMSFSEKSNRGIPEGTPFAYEGDILPVISPWVQQWQCQLHHVVGDQWQVYHLAAVLAANFLPLFIRGGSQLLAQLTAGDDQKALDWLAPLVKASVAKGLNQKITRPYSGPAVRGDEKVLQSQAEYLGENLPEWRELYRLASGLIQNEAAEKDSLKKT